MQRKQRRAADRWIINVRENAYRDVWLLVITGVCVLALWSNHVTLTQQAKGRHFAVGATCAAISAISEAGRQVIESGAAGVSGRFERELERLGYPPRSVRQAQAQIASSMYVQSISRRVQSQVGRRAARLIRADGTIDCQQLQRLASATASH